MKSLKSILESIKPWGSHLVWNMKGTINDNYGKFREIYNDKVRDTLVEFILECGENNKWHTFFFKPVKIEFDYKLTTKHTQGLMCGLWLNDKNEPILFVDCMDGDKLFSIGIDDLVNSSKLSRLRNDVIIGEEHIYKLLNSPYLEHQVTKTECQKLRKEELDRVLSDGGQLVDRLRGFLKSRDYDGIIKELKQLVDLKGGKYRNGKSIKLKRTDRFWNNYISEIILINDELWLNVYWQGDSTDGDEEIKLSTLLKDRKVIVKHRNERFTVDYDSLNDMFDDLEYYLLNKK